MKRSYAKRIADIPFVGSFYKSINKRVNHFYRQDHVAMLHTGRCGSTVIAQMLDSHSKVVWDGEIFEKKMQVEGGIQGREFAEETINNNRDLEISKMYGFETKYLPHHHLSKRGIDMDLEDYIELLRDLGFGKFIVLHRNNYLRRAISGQIGLHTKKWHSNSSVIKPTKIKLDVNAIGTDPMSLLSLFKMMDEGAIQLKKVLSRDAVLHLVYEEDIMNDPQVAYGKICNFLGLIDEHPVITLKRTNPFEYDEMIVNFNEVCAVLEGTEYKWMLNAW